MTHPSPPTPDMAPLDTEVLSRHGLRRQPFAPRATDRFVYSDPALDMPIGVVLQRLQTDNKPLLLVGERGVGKSTQLVQLLSRGTAALSFCAFKGRPGASFASIEHAIRQQWGKAVAGQGTGEPDLEPATKQAAEKNSLAMILLSIARGDRRPVLVIDDAHLLAPAVLGSLLRLRREVNRHSDNTMGIVLAGEPELNELAVSAYGPETPAEAFAVIRLRPLMESQTDAYLRHRLQAAGASDPGLLSGEHAHAIHRESGGLPAKVNDAANRHLEKLVPEPSAGAGAADRISGVTMDGSARERSYWVVPAAAGAFGMLVGALITSLFFLSEDRLAQPDQAAQEQEIPSKDAWPATAPLPITSTPGASEVPESQPTMPPTVLDAAPAPQPSPEARLRTFSDTLDDSRMAAESAQVPDTAPLDDAAPSADGADLMAPSQALGPTDLPVSEPTSPVARDPAIAAEEAGSLDAEQAMESTGPAELPDQPREMTSAAPEPLATDALPEVAEDADRRVAETPAATPIPPAPAGPRGPEWVRERPAGQFTIQIIAGVDLEELRRFARRVSMETDVAWFHTRRGDQDWYALVTGEYPDLASAQAAAARLPAPVRRNQPWIRTFGSVQQAMDPSS